MKFYLLLSIIFSAFISSSLGDEVAFIKIGTYSGFDKNQNWITKSFHVPRYFEATWINAAMICQFYDMQLARFDTDAEFESVRQMMINNTEHLTTYIYIDGMATVGKSTTEWFWSKPSEKIAFPIPWSPNEPNQNSQRCLALGPKNENFYFDDNNCNGSNKKFLCQNLEAIATNT